MQVRCNDASSCLGDSDEALVREPADDALGVTADRDDDESEAGATVSCTFAAELLEDVLALAVFAGR